MKNEEPKKKRKNARDDECYTVNDNHECIFLMCIREGKVVLKNLRAAK